ncbi:MAG: DUF4157 domain-containing protein, partial [Bacteroidota bacterium]
GNEITFAPGKFQPDTQEGKELIGHELTHVKQQRLGRVQPTSYTQGLPINDDPSLEQEADAFGKQLATNSTRQEDISFHPSSDLALEKESPELIQASQTTQKKRDTKYSTNTSTIQLKPSDYAVSEDGNQVETRIQDKIDADVEAGDGEEREPHEVERSEIRSKTRQNRSRAKPDVDRPGEQLPKVEEQASNVKEKQEEPVSGEEGENHEPQKTDSSEGAQRSGSKADSKATEAAGAFNTSESISIPEEEPDVVPPPISELKDASDSPLQENNPGATNQTFELAGKAQTLREMGRQMRLNAANEKANAEILKGNMALMESEMNKSDQGTDKAIESLEYRRTVLDQSKEALTQSEEKAEMVANEAPGLQEKANEGQDETGPMAEEAKAKNSENESRMPEDEDARRDAEKQGNKMNESSEGAENMDEAIAETKTKALSLGEDAALAQQKNTESKGKIEETEKTLQNTDQKINELKTLNQSARDNLAPLTRQPDMMIQQADEIDSRGQEIIGQSWEMEALLQQNQLEYEANMGQVLPQAEPPEQIKDLLDEDGNVSDDALNERQAAGVNSDASPEPIQGYWEDLDQGNVAESGEEQSLPVSMDTEAAPLDAQTVIQRRPEQGYEDREQLDLLQSFSEEQTLTEEQRQQQQEAAEARRRNNLQFIEDQAAGGFENLSATDKMGIALRLTGRNLFGGLSNFQWPSAGQLLLSLVNPVDSLKGVVSGFSMMLSGAMNLFSAEQWKRDPIGNLLKSAADIATGLTVILGSITALAGVIIAIMTAITIATLGFAAPVTGPIISFCASVLTVVGGRKT